MMSTQQLMAIREEVMSNSEEHLVHHMPVRTDGCIDNRSMMNIKCDHCKLHIDRKELVVCTPCGNDYHLTCAAGIHTKLPTDTRMITHAERMDEYMQERFRNGQSKKDMEDLMSALKLRSNFLPPSTMPRLERAATAPP